MPFVLSVYCPCPMCIVVVLSLHCISITGLCIGVVSILFAPCLFLSSFFFFIFVLFSACLVCVLFVFVVDFPLFFYVPVVLVCISL